jgi:hypothetical protein
MSDNAPVNAEQPKGTTPCAPQGGDPSECKELPEAPKAPTLPPPKECPQPCDCPAPPGGPPNDCFETLIADQSKLVTQADRAKALVEELTAIQAKAASAKAEYTQARYKDLKKRWEDQDKLIADFTDKIKCTVDCWECLLECRLCPLLTEIRQLEDRLNGTGELTDKVYSLRDLQSWHQRNVEQLQARVDRIKGVLAAWEKPSATLGEALESNGTLIADLPAVLAADPAKAIYDTFMTLLPRHWAIRPRGATSKIKEVFIKICKCDEGTPDVCCSLDVGVPTLRERLLKPLPYIVDPVDFSGIICCLLTRRLTPASDQLAAAQAELAATTSEIEQAKKLIDDKTAALEATFKAELGNPIECDDYKKKSPEGTPPAQPPEGGGGDTKQTDQTAS